MEGQKIINFGDRAEQFVLAVDPVSGLPAWCTVKDEFWISMVGSILYDYLVSHAGSCMNKNLTDKRSAAGEMMWSDFKASILSGEGARFKDIVIELYNVLSKTKDTSNFTDIRTYISFFSEVSDHFINVMIEGNSIKIGINLMDQ